MSTRKTPAQRAAEMAEYLLRHHLPDTDDAPVVCPGILVDEGCEYLGTLQNPMQYTGKPRSDRPRYMLRMFLRRIGNSKAERVKLATAYKALLRGGKNEGI